jgi:hypothetical protein
VFEFRAPELGLSADEWAANKIHFSAARNLGRARVRTPWVLVVDSDEYVLAGDVDLRAMVAGAPTTLGAFSVLVQLEQKPGITVFEQRDYQRLARAEYRWEQETHNQLRVTAPADPGLIEPARLTIVSDTSLRSVTEQSRRDMQRELGIEELIKEAAGGNLNALFHVAKHRAGSGDIAEAVQYAEDFRLRVEPNSVLSYQRQWVALSVAFRFYHEDNAQEANRWACRVLLDGPALPAFCLLGDLAEEAGDLKRARAWYEAACAITPEVGDMTWPGLIEMRQGRLAGIRRALAGLPVPAVPA